MKAYGVKNVGLAVRRWDCVWTPASNAMHSKTAEKGGPRDNTRMSGHSQDLWGYGNEWVAVTGTGAGVVGPRPGEELKVPWTFLLFVVDPCDKYVMIIVISSRGSSRCICFAFWGPPRTWTIRDRCNQKWLHNSCINSFGRGLLVF